MAFRLADRKEVVHQIDWIEPDSLEPQTKSVKTPDDLRELLNTLLQTHLTGNTPSFVMLVSAFADREKILNAYNIAVQERYRFFSFGDAMFIY